MSTETASYIQIEIVGADLHHPFISFNVGDNDGDSKSNNDALYPSVYNSLPRP